MKLARRPSYPAVLEPPEWFDPSGIPWVDARRARRRATTSRRRDHDSLPGLHATAVVASVEEIVSGDGGDHLLAWGSVGGRPVLFEVDARSATEMAGSIRAGENATAIVEPSQVVLERLD